MYAAVAPAVSCQRYGESSDDRQKRLKGEHAQLTKWKKLPLSSIPHSAILSITIARVPVWK